MNQANPPKAEPTNAQEVSAHLDSVTIKQLTWKPDITRDIAVQLADRFIRDRIAYTDEVDLSFVPTFHANCIGTTYRRLKQAGIIEETGRCRQSSMKKKPGRKGSKAFQWRLKSEALARKFIEVNGGVVSVKVGQSEMFEIGSVKSAKPKH